MLQTSCFWLRLYSQQESTSAMCEQLCNSLANSLYLHFARLLLAWDVYVVREAADSSHTFPFWALVECGELFLERSIRDKMLHRQVRTYNQESKQCEEKCRDWTTKAAATP